MLAEEIPWIKTLGRFNIYHMDFKNTKLYEPKKENEKKDVNTQSQYMNAIKR